MTRWGPKDAKADRRTIQKRLDYLERMANSGPIRLSRIPPLPASIIQSGTLANARFPERLAAAQTLGVVNTFDITETGWHVVGPNAAGSPVAAQSHFVYTVVEASGNRWQQAIAVGVQAQTTWQRRYAAGIGWGAWSRVFQTRTTFTPTFNSGVTIGNGAVAGAYTISGGFLVGWAQLTVGSTTAFTGDVIMDYPVAPSSTEYRYWGGGRCQIGGGIRDLLVMCAGNGVFLRTRQVTGSYLSQVGLSATVPGTWSTGDLLYASFGYPTI